MADHEDSDDKTTNAFHIHDHLRRIEGLAPGDLTEEHIRRCWEAEHRTDRSYTVGACLCAEEVPHDLCDDFLHYVMKHTVEGALRHRSPGFGLRLPMIVNWIYRNESKFRDVAMDHAAFVREILSDERFGARIRWQIACWPSLLEVLAEEERWQRLREAVREHGATIDWGFAARAATWSAEKSVALVGEVITDPEIAGAFLGNSEAHYGWLAFQDLGAFLSAVREAARLAPYEAYQNRRWLATKVGDLKTGRNFMARDFGWSNWPEKYWEELAPQGEAEVRALLSEIIGSTLESALINESQPLSRCSRELVARIKRLPAVITSPKKMEDLGAVLVDLPECDLGKRLLTRAFACETDYLGLGLRWLMSPEYRWSRDRFLVYSDAGSANIRDYHRNELFMSSWFARLFRLEMTKCGWAFHRIEKRRNERFVESSPRGYDLEVKRECGKEIHIYKLYRGLLQNGDSYREGQEVMIPPNFTLRGSPVFEKGRLKIYAPVELPLMVPVTGDIRKWWFHHEPDFLRR